MYRAVPVCAVISWFEIVVRAAKETLAEISAAHELGDSALRPASHPQLTSASSSSATSATSSQVRHRRQSAVDRFFSDEFSSDKTEERTAMLEKLAEAVDQTSQLGEKVISTLIDRHLDRAALSINIKGVLSTVAYLIGVVVRMLALVCVCLYPFAIVGMELFQGRKLKCDATGEFTYWFKCDYENEKRANFQSFLRAYLSLYQAFYTGDVCAFVQATSQVRAPAVATAFWGIFYMLVYIVLMDVFISTVIEHYEKRLKQSDEKMEHALIEAAVHRGDRSFERSRALQASGAIIEMGLPRADASDMDEILVLS